MKKTYKLIFLLVIFTLLLSSCNQDGLLSENMNDSIVAEDVLADLLVSDGSSQTEENDNLPPYREGDFYILYTEDEVDFSKAPKAEIKLYPWNKDYKPYAYGQLVFKKDDGFYLFMYCEEKNPKAEVTENGGSVYLDSALEFFCDYRPENKKYGGVNYINLEMNSKGVYLANYGRRSVAKISKTPIEVKGNVYDNYWTVEAHIPLKTIHDVYGEYDIGIGSKVECNFTKCGSGTDIPHWGTWRALVGDTPNFHQPQYFKKVYIRKYQG